MRIENEKMENERMENTKMEDERMEQYSIIGKEDLIGMLKTNYEQIGIILSTLEESGYMNQDRWNRFGGGGEELKITEKEIEKF